MNAQQAITIMAGKAQGDKGAAIQAIENEMSVATRKGLHEWLWSGSGMYTGEETIDSLEAEWKSINEEADE